MPPRKRAGGRRRDDDEGNGDAPELSRNPDADPVQIHRDYVERRIGGGAPPTSDAYARALEQFHEIPGAVRRPPSEVTGESVERRSASPGRAARAAEAADEDFRASGEVPEADVRGAPGDADDTGGAWEPER